MHIIEYMSRLFVWQANKPNLKAPKEDGDGGSCKCKNTGKRNLVVCIDGTSNKFGTKNTNIVELYSRLIKNDQQGDEIEQRTFYNSGIGTYAEPSWKSPGYWKQVIAHYLDLAFALRFETILLDAYRWLSEMYRPGDRIYLFGFSRGAYQVRALAGMIEKVGLIHKGNEAQIPFAYELYARSTDYQPETEPEEDSLEYMPWRFKTTFSRPDVRVHFVGAWDTVSSVGFVRPTKGLPLTTSGMTHVCYFRHALALDERRVKFLPEYVSGGESLCSNTSEANDTPDLEDLSVGGDSSLDSSERSSSSIRPPTKEVWFPGTHSDIGGGNAVNKGLNSYGPALRWMRHEAILAGLLVEPPQRQKRPAGTDDDIAELKDNIARNDNFKKESLTWIWWIFEVLPIRRLSFKNAQDTTYWPQMGAPRQIVEGQWIHASAYQGCRDSLFKARLPSNWELEDGKVHPSKIEEDLYKKARENLLPVLEKPRIDPNRFINHLTALVEISSSPEGVDSLCEIKNSAQDLYSTLGNIENPFEHWKLKASKLIIIILMKYPPGCLSKHDSDKMPDVITALRESTTPVHQSHAKQFMEALGTAEVSCVRLECDRDWLRFGSIALSPDHKQIAASGRRSNTRIGLWDAANGEALIEPIINPKEVNCVAFSPDCRKIVSGSDDGTVRVWDAMSGDELHVFKGHKGMVLSVAFCPLVSHAHITGSHDKTVRVWDLGTEQVLHVLEGHSSQVMCIAYSPEGRKLASGSFDATVRIWDAETGETICVLKGHKAPIYTLIFSPSGTQLVSGSNSNIRIWDVLTGRILQVLREGHTNAIRAVAYSPDSKQIVSGSDDRTACVWNAETGKLLSVHEGHSRSVRFVAFSPDAQRVISCSSDCTLREWDLTGEWCKESKFLIGPSKS
ncbi:WD40 repeat-like protein [Gymnopus androsaceus JB14]|uniref:WD40 repeat-like protein n=1 Tax=Gymnopus androsaceus JB14 TaxID=1447944 RepID=A0A6A4GH31_9AGAR|nr:WD40 repeat-like protein [Gymnopus androsaceus JB14]